VYNGRKLGEEEIEVPELAEVLRDLNAKSKQETTREKSQTESSQPQTGIFSHGQAGPRRHP